MKNEGAIDRSSRIVQGKNGLTRLLISICILASVVLNANADEQSLVMEARQNIQGFGSALKQTLQKGIKEQGIVNSLGICYEQAPDIAEQLSTNGWTLSRTSLKYRNQQNAPDSWERSVLQQFEKRLAAGESANKLESSKQQNGEFRYMKAIPTGEVCLKCHGNNIAPVVISKLDTLYPDDKARGSELGQIRGAFSLTKKLTD